MQIIPALTGKEARLFHEWNRFAEALNQGLCKPEPSDLTSDGRAWAYSPRGDLLVNVGGQALSAWQRQALSKNGTEGMVYEDHPEFTALIKAVKAVPWM